ncbi:Uncharacterised protein [Mycobacteroides abscessus subsp. abscessus]|nr:Uncharacterised protein [Mycobacteroides abscessus subsp. abscessus]
MAAPILARSGDAIGPIDGRLWTVVPRYDGGAVAWSASATPTIRSCSPSAQSVSIAPASRTTMRLASSGTSVSPWACRTSRGADESTAAASFAQDSSGLRALPNTPALAIFVVLVARVLGVSLVGFSVQPDTVAVTSAADIAAAPHNLAVCTRSNLPGEPSNTRVGPRKSPVSTVASLKYDSV